MRVLIACEFSGVVRRAMREEGHDAYSCDLLPSEDDSPHHIQGDAIDAIRRGCPADDTQGAGWPWDFIGIHYTCTFFCNSGVRWMFTNGRGHEIDLVRRGQMLLAAKEFSQLWGAAVATGARVYFENPVMHHHAAEAIADKIRGWQRRPTQIIQPHQFGHGEIKKTGLWLHRLPPLTPTHNVEGRHARVHLASPGPDRWKERSRTYSGIAKAMASQWGALVLSAD